MWGFGRCHTQKYFTMQIRASERWCCRIFDHFSEVHDIYPKLENIPVQNILFPIAEQALSVLSWEEEGIGDAEKATAHRAEIVVFLRSRGIGDAWRLQSWREVSRVSKKSTTSCLPGLPCMLLARPEGTPRLLCPSCWTIALDSASLIYSAKSEQHREESSETVFE